MKRMRQKQAQIGCYVILVIIPRRIVLAGCLSRSAPPIVQLYSVLLLRHPVIRAWQGLELSNTIY